MKTVLSKRTKIKIERNKKALEKEGITDPYNNPEYECSTCGNVGLSHPVTSYCFVCGDDNWTFVKKF